MPAGTTTYNYVDVFVNPAFGTVAVADANAVRPARAALSPAAAATRRLRLGFVAVLFGSLGLLVAWVGGRQALADWRLWSALQRVDGVVTRQVTFNFYLEERLLPRIAALDRLLTGPLISRSGGSG